MASPNTLKMRGDRKRLVHVLHKRQQIPGAEEGMTELAVGKDFRFPSGDTYRVHESGALVKINRKNHFSKAQRKADKRDRVAQRRNQRVEASHE